MDKKSKLPSMEEASANVRSAAKTWIDLSAAQAQSYERLVRTQLGHVTQQAREFNEFAGAMAEANLKVWEQARQQGAELVEKALA